MSLNKIMIIGNLGDNPEVRSTPGGQTVATLRIATNERWTDKSGQQQERTEWHRVVVWGKQAEHCGTYLSKGRQVFVEGRVQTREWNDKEGNKRYTTEVVAQRVQFLGGGSGRSEGQGAPAEGRGRSVGGFPPPATEAPMDAAVGDDDVPF